MASNDNGIQQFWQWFVENERTIQDCIENENSSHRDSIIDQMNEHILSLGVLTWDIGLNDDQNWFLMLSPNGNSDMLKVSQKIIDFAPEHMGWSFHASKPAKIWNRQFTFYDNYMDEQLIDATAWNYVLFEDEQAGKFDLILEAKNISHLDSEDAEAAAEQFVIQEIGESLRISQLSTIEIVHELNSEHASSKALVSELRDHLDELL